MSDEPIKVSEDSSINIPLRNLISLLGAVATAVWGYSVLDNRITTLENETRSLNEQAQRLEQSNRDAATGLDPWATDVEQSTRIQRVESDVKRIEELYLQKHKD
jgi:uncharacterized protein YlxW (UPF0749 family)